MKFLKLSATVCALALMSAPVNAFQETHVTPGSAVKTDAPEKALAGSGKNSDAVELTTPSMDENSSKGTEISIPGLGTIGKLPKLDFGLELLYGAGENRDTFEATTAPEDKEADSNVMIRGTVKHRF